MSLIQSAGSPDEGGKLPHFTHLKTHLGEKWTAYKAGPAMWFDCHQSLRSKPCLERITGGALKCKCETELTPITDLGYLPVFREFDGKYGFIVLHNEQKEIERSIPHLRRMTVGRGRDKADGIYIAPTLDPRPLFSTRLEWKLKPVDLEETLLRLWRIPELVEWVRQQKARSAEVVRPVVEASRGEPVKSDGEPFSPMTRAAAIAAGATTAAIEADELFSAALKRTQERLSSMADPPSNGKHRKKGKGDADTHRKRGKPS